jgi:hypothetical protein
VEAKVRKNEIPRKEWPAFFRWLDETHYGHICSLAVEAEDERARLRLHPLMFATLDPEIDRDNTRFRVILANWSGDQLAHVIVDPRHVFMSREPEVTERVEIDSAAGKTVMTFQPAV